LIRPIEKYKFRFKPVSVREDGAGVAVAIEVSGTFSGSPVTPDYHFVVEKDKILSLRID
jgi:hypothetical protein